MKKNYIMNILYICSFFILGIFCFYFLGDDGYEWYEDSVSYASIGGEEGVMPLYPLFLYFIDLLFRGKDYLEAVVWAQAILSAICVGIFVIYIVKNFSLKWWEGYFIFIACLLPFAIDLPGYMVSHKILTEGIAYPLFYLFFLFLIDAICKKNRKSMLAAIIAATFLALTRSQLLLTYILCAAAAFYIEIRLGLIHRKWIAGAVKGALLGIAVIAAGMFLTTKLYGIYLNDIVPTLKEANTEQYETEKVMKTETDEEAAESRVENSQFNSAIFNRGFFEADKEDVLLFREGEEQEIFSLLYDTLSKEDFLHSSAQKGLWMWKDLTTGSLGVRASEILREYYKEKNPEISNVTLYNKVSETMAEMGRVILIKHLGRYIYHSMRLMVPGFINSVFFQIEKIYLLCHIITAGIYLSAVAGCIYYGIKGRKIKNFTASAIEFLGAAILGNIILVSVTNLVFQGIQRYVVYIFGIFYVAFYVLIRQIYLMWLPCLKERYRRKNRLATAEAQEE